MRWLAGALSALLLVACGSPGVAPAELTESGADDAENSSGGGVEWQTDFGLLADGVRIDDFRRATLFRDAIPALSGPHLTRAGDVDWIGADEPVIAVGLSGDWRAYPLQVLIWHEIANDHLGGRPIAVTFCPLCHTAVVYDRELEGEVLEFGVTGYLRRSDQVMYDRQTESWWQQATGLGLVGAYAGRRLRILPSSLVAWEAFAAAHPDAMVVDGATGYARPYGQNPYPGWDRIERNPFLGDAQLEACNGAPACLDPKERVGVVTVDDRTVVYPFRTVAAAGGLVTDRVAGRSIVVWWLPNVRTVLDSDLLSRGDQVGTMVAFDARVGRSLIRPILDGEGLRDTVSGVIWDSLGHAQPPARGAPDLTRLTIDTPYWFGFAAFGSGYRIWRHGPDPG